MSVDRTDIPALQVDGNRWFRLQPVPDLVNVADGWRHHVDGPAFHVFEAAIRMQPVGIGHVSLGYLAATKHTQKSPDRMIVNRRFLARPPNKADDRKPFLRITMQQVLPRMDSSTSMLARLRNSMAVGRMLLSPSDITGNSNGRPPAS